MFPQRPRPPMHPPQQGRPHPPFNRPRPPFGPGPQQMGMNQPPSNPLQNLQSLFKGNQQQGNPQLPGNPQPGQMQGIMELFQTPEGNWDIEKLISTAQQVNGVYKQVSPLVTQFLKK